jgi:hypothetical protein
MRSGLWKRAFGPRDGLRHDTFPRVSRGGRYRGTGRKCRALGHSSARFSFGGGICGATSSPGVQRAVTKPTRSSMSHTSGTATATKQSSRTLPAAHPIRPSPLHHAGSARSRGGPLMCRAPLGMCLCGALPRRRRPNDLKSRPTPEPSSGQHPPTADSPSRPLPSAVPDRRLYARAH